MSKRDVNLLAAELLGFDKIMNKHTHIVWGRKDGRQHQINIYNRRDQLLELVDILVRKVSIENVTTKGMLYHYIQTRHTTAEALEDFVEEALTRLTGS